MTARAEGVDGLLYELAEDTWARMQKEERLDPRLKAGFMWPWTFMGIVAKAGDQDFKTREDLLARRIELEEMSKKALMKMFQDGQVPPAPAETRHFFDDEGIEMSKETITSQPDGNTILLSIARPKDAGDGPLPCVLYMHGGGMAFLSAFDQPYQNVARVLAKQGVVVVMPDFRNCEVPTETSKEVKEFPAGLNDCFSALKWVHASKEALGIDERIIIAGESGGGNLTLALGLKAIREGCRDLIKHGVHASCPYIAASWPQDVSNNGILGTSHLSSEMNGLFVRLPSSRRSALSYGEEALANKDPLAWPAYATDDDLKQFPRTSILVHELDPLRDEGIMFYRRLAKQGVRASCRQLMGMLHASELMGDYLPEIAVENFSLLAAMAKNDLKETRP